MRAVLRILGTRAFLTHWAALFAFWYILSGMNRALYLFIGALGAAAVAFVSYDMQLTEQADDRDTGVHFYVLPWHRLALYGVWLLKEIALANWAVLKLVLDPRLPIDPAMIRFRTRLESSIGRTILANSITLTPGTITVDIVGDELIVHALVGGEPAVAGITAMQNRIARALIGIEALPEVSV